MDFYIGIFIQIILFVILSQSYNILYGYTNMMFLGLVGLYAVGAYTGGLLLLQGVNFWLALGAAVLFTGLLSFIIALPTVRFKGDFLAIVTLGFSQIIGSIIINWSDLTRGPRGLPGIKRPLIFGVSIDKEIMFLIFTAIIGAIILIFYYRLCHSPFGKTLETIREDDIASHSIGKHINRYRIQVITIVGAVVGCVGMLNVIFIRFTDPSVYSLEFLSLILLAVFAGGPGKYWGTVIAAAVLISIQELLLLIDRWENIIGPLSWIILCSILVGILIYKPTGLLGKKIIKKNY